MLTFLTEPVCTAVIFLTELVRTVYCTLLISLTELVRTVLTFCTELVCTVLICITEPVLTVLARVHSDSLHDTYVLHVRIHININM